MSVLIILKILGLFLLAVFLAGALCVFFDQAILTRKGTVYRVKTPQKKVVLTFDDGPSPVWTPQILDVLKEENVKAAFFLIGYHVRKYPQIAQRIVREGHTIGNHGFAHTTLLYYTPAEIEQEIKYSESVIKEVTGQVPQYFRPPKAWLRKSTKNVIRSMGYEIILWSLNSKDWVMFNHHSMVKYLSRKVRNGDIILFHDSGDVFKAEGGNRRQTLKAIPLLVKELRKRGFEFVTIEELLNHSLKNV